MSWFVLHFFKSFPTPPLSAVLPVTRSLDVDQLITTSLGTTANLSFTITGAVPPVQVSQIQWIYSSTFSITPFNATNVDITGLASRNTISQYTYSTNLLSLTISNIGPADIGRYFLSAMTVAGVSYSYIDVNVQGKVLSSWIANELFICLFFYLVLVL